MTWEEFINSDYNDGKIVLSYSNIFLIKDGGWCSIAVDWKNDVEASAAIEAREYISTTCSN